MKKIYCFVLMCLMCCSLIGCGQMCKHENIKETYCSPQGVQPYTKRECADCGYYLGYIIHAEENSSEQQMGITELKQGDEVSIIGQVAAGVLADGDTLWVQVQREDKTFVLYKCQLKDEWVSKAESYEMVDAVRIKGLFLSLTDLKIENTMPTIVLYDCEIID